MDQSNNTALWTPQNVILHPFTLWWECIHLVEKLIFFKMKFKLHSPVWPQPAPIQWWSDLFLDNSKMVSNYYGWLSEWKIYIILLQLLQAQSLKSTIHHLETIWHVLFTWSWQLRLHSQKRRGFFLLLLQRPGKPIRDWKVLWILILGNW